METQRQENKRQYEESADKMFGETAHAAKTIDPYQNPYGRQKYLTVINSYISSIFAREDNIYNISIYPNI